VNELISREDAFPSSSSNDAADPMLLTDKEFIRKTQECKRMAKEQLRRSQGG
jgi:hypothetical protein